MGVFYYCKAKRRRERVKSIKLKFFLSLSHLTVTAPSSEGAKVCAINQLTSKRKFRFFTAPFHLVFYFIPRSVSSKHI